MTPGRLTLETWLARTYAAGEGPTLATARRWARDNKLDPPAVKEGRSYWAQRILRSLVPVGYVPDPWHELVSKFLGTLKDLVEVVDDE